jgi:hypothetical protein
MSNMKNIMNKDFVFMKKLFAPTLSLLLLTGCWHVPVSAIWRLQKLDTLAIDPAGVRLAARIPDWLDAAPGHVHLKTVSHAGEPDAQERTLDLVRDDAPADLRALNADEGVAGARFAVFRVSAADAAWLRALQARARAEKAAGESGHKGSLQLTAEPCRRAEPPPGPARVDLYLRPGEGEGFFKVYDNVDLREAGLFANKTFEDAVPPCGKIARRAE